MVKRSEAIKRSLRKIVWVELKNLPNIVVYTPARDDWNTLMKVYESGGWVWADGSFPTADRGQWDTGRKNCVNAHNHFQFGSRSFYERKGRAVI